jgi:hypothetical protein
VIDSRVIETAGTGVTASTRAPVYKQDGNTVWIAGLIHIQLVQLRHLKGVTLVRFQFRIENEHVAFLLQWALGVKVCLLFRYVVRCDCWPD